MANVERVNGNAVLRREWRTLARLVADSFIAGLVVSLALALAVFIVTTPAAHAAPAETPPGMLYLKDAAGGRTASPLVFTDVHMSVTGMIARVAVTQRFVNPTPDWREGVYVFPLPEKAAVDHLAMRVGQRVIEGQIKERGEAKATYEAAKQQGRKTTLVEEERPNLFTTSVANIGPSEEITVAIEYQETVRYDAGTFRLRFPLAVTPRYIPGTAVAGGNGLGWSPATQQVLDAERITPPVVARADGYVNPVRIAIDLDAGVPLAALASTYHKVAIEDRGQHRFRLTLADGPIPAARDFELAWTPDTGAAPAAALFTQTLGGKTYALLMALPPSAAGDAPRVPREVTYIIDTSGSMEGVSIAQARDALAMALDRLQAGDRFNVIEFNSVTRALFAAPMPVDAETMARARQFVSALRASGGTEMLGALQAALAGPRDAAMLRQVVFLTDGAVGNEDAILRFVSEAIGDRRLFTVGIGPAPNSFFMTKAAQFGRGTYTYIGDVREVQEKMTALFRKLESPALTDISVDWPAGADVWPRTLPDLYAGEPIVVAAQFNANALQGTVALAGRRAGQAFGMVLPASGEGDAPGVGVLWARSRIDALMDAGRRGAAPDEIRNAVLDVALTHHLVSKYTSLVAVDVTPTAPAGTTPLPSALPGNVPEGLTGFDQLPRTATPAPLLLAIGAATLLLAAVLALRLRAAGALALLAVVAVAVAMPEEAGAQAARKTAQARNLLLLPGHYDGDAGSLGADLAAMPDRGWFVLVKDAAGSYVRRIPDNDGARPLFLRELERASPDNRATLQSALGQLFYVNLAHSTLREGPVTEVALRRRVLAPANGKPYALTLGHTPFTLTVNNGRQGRAGAHYVLAIGGATYEWLLAGFGWDSEIQYAGDLDRDGKPDLVVYVNGNDRGTWYLLLSGAAHPGMNAPAAQLTGSGC